MPPQASEYAKKRLRELGDGVLSGFEVLLAKELQKIRSDFEEHFQETQPALGRVTSKTSTVSRIATSNSAGHNIVLTSAESPRPPAGVGGADWEADLWKVAPEEQSDDETASDTDAILEAEAGWESPGGEREHFVTFTASTALGAERSPSSPTENRSGASLFPPLPKDLSSHSDNSTPLAGSSPGQLHDIWEREDFVRQVSKNSGASLGKDFIGRLSQKSNLRSGQEVQENGLLQLAVMRPGSFRCLIWDMVCTLAIIHDVLMIPVLSAFPIDKTGLPAQLEIASSIVWLLDLFVSFFRGFLDVRTGFVEMRFTRIARQYVTHWFFADLSMILLDAFSLFLDDTGVGALTLLRLLRNLRLLRLLKMNDRFTIIREMFFTLEFELEWTSVYLGTFMGVFQHLGVIALLCHFTGCAWYALGQMTSSEITWVKAHASERGAEFSASAGWFYFYMTSVQWALTQFTPAAMDVSAVNTPERLFSVVVCLAGLIAFSFFLGTINQSFAKLRSLTAQETKQNQLVRRYVGERRVSADLSSEVLACIRQRGLGKATGKVVFSDIKVLQNLPTNLLGRLQEEVGFPILEQHGVFKYLTYLSVFDVQRLCHTALTESSVIYGEDLFDAGALGHCMYMIQGGRLHYSWELSQQVEEVVLPGHRASEAALWLKWEHRGRMTCSDQSSHIFQVSASALHKIMAKSENRDLMSMYAKTFVRSMLEHHGSVDEASDLFGDDELVAKLLKPIRTWQAGVMSLMPAGNPALQVRAIFLAWKSLLREKTDTGDGQPKWLCVFTGRRPGGWRRKSTS